MQRLFPAFGAAALAVVIVGGAVALAAGDGPVAFSVGDTRVSQTQLDGELEVLAEHPDFAAGLVGAEVVAGDGSVPSSLSTSWVTFRIVTAYTSEALEARGERITDADRDATGLESVAGFNELPADFRGRIVRDFASLRALQRVLGDDPDGNVSDTALAACSSGRFVSHILVATEAEATAIAADLAAGADFGELAVERSTDPGSAVVGGELGCLDQLGDAVAEFLTAAESQPVGTVSAPVQTEFGFHLILVTDTPSRSDLDAAAIGAVLTDVSEERVEVDARYGRWDPATAQVVAGGATG